MRCKLIVFTESHIKYEHYLVNSNTMNNILVKLEYRKHSARLVGWKHFSFTSRRTVPGLLIPILNNKMISKCRQTVIAPGIILLLND